jgi:hypothetical protein
LAALFVSFIPFSASAQVFDSYSLELGRGTDATMYKVGAQKFLGQNNAFLNDYALRPYVELSVAALRERKYQNMPGHSRTVTDFGLTPVLRWQPNVMQGFFLEGGVGLNYMTDRYNNAGKAASTKFQFGDHVGVGYTFNNSLELTVKYQHFSNASIKQPNPAINFISVKVAYAF